MFAFKGNVIDLAIGVIIGWSFGKTVTSLVNDIIMPPIGMLVGRGDFFKLAISLNEHTEIRYGEFLNNVISFLIIVFVFFVVIRKINRIRIPFLGDEEKALTTKSCPFCCSTIPIHTTRCPNCTSELPETTEMVKMLS